jgi:cell division protein FtsI/penicillin-binding protein 2
MGSKHRPPASWRTYQASLHRSARRNKLKKLLGISVILGGAIACMAAFYVGVHWLSLHFNAKESPPPPSENQPPAMPPSLTRRDLPGFLYSEEAPLRVLDSQFVMAKNGSRYKISTTIHSKLQSYTERLLANSMTHQAAVVVMNPFDGRILALADRDRQNRNGGLCLRAEFPAASLFKIVSAAAAMEKAGYTPDKTIFYVGNRHTLYKKQLTREKGRYSVKTKFRRAFAASNNIVFGKLGMYDLGQDILTDYAMRFQFNRSIPFDLPLGVSTIDVPEEDFGLAEIASGFNKRTLISPLHAALLAATVANRGQMSTPWIITTIRDENDAMRYRAGRETITAPIAEQTASKLKVLMGDAARYGTSRTAFRKLRRQKIFNEFELGAKTGTINDHRDRYKYDWIAAYALKPDHSEGISVGILAVHGKLLGVRATELARAVIDYYFKS